MANDFDFQRLMSAFGGAFFGAIIGGIIGLLIYLALDLLNINIDNTVKLAIIWACILAGMILLAYHEVKKHASRHRA
jgi:hypothetical protein